MCRSYRYMGLDPDRLKIPESGIAETLKTPSKALPRHRKGELFLKGPIPLSWLGLAARLPGKALAVGVAVWFLGWVEKRRQVKLTGKTCRRFGLNRYAVRRGLDALEEARLVTAERHSGRTPIVTILEPPESPCGTHQTEGN
jgi:hypothetical protein